MLCVIYILCNILCSNRCMYTTARAPHNRRAHCAPPPTPPHHRARAITITTTTTTAAMPVHLRAPHTLLTLVRIQRHGTRGASGLRAHPQHAHAHASTCATRTGAPRQRLSPPRKRAPAYTRHSTHHHVCTLLRNRCAVHAQSLRPHSLGRSSSRFCAATCVACNVLT